MLHRCVRRTPFARALAVGLLVVTMITTSEGAAVAMAPPPAEPPARSADRRAGIDTTDQAAVRAAWRTMVASRAGASANWTGRRDSCRAGRPSVASTRTILGGINFARGLAGLTPVYFSRSLSAKAQQAALIMSANDTLSHDVPRAWKCWSRAGAKAASRSNLYYGWEQLKPDEIVPGYLTEPGAGNVYAGHRRWILNPTAKAFGNGLTKNSHALYVVGPTTRRNANPSWVPWPTAGWFPSDLEPEGLWSLAAGSTRADFSRARVRVVRDGTRLRVHRHRFVRGYGMPTITWDVRGALGPGTYTVTVAGIRGAAAPRVTYTVRIFRP